MALLVDIRKKLGRFQLDVSLEAPGGAVTGLLGASGCGKSLTLKCIAGVERPDEGKIILDGRVLFDSQRRIDLPPQKRGVGYLFQNYALFPNMTAAQNIAAGVRRPARRRAAVRALLSAFRLEGLEDQYPRRLSGGQQQRVALARILAGEPGLLLLDEPFSALDSYLKRQVELELTGHLSSFPGPVLFVTHDRDEIRRNCRQVCVLDRGASQPVRPVRRLFETPDTLPACLLSGCENISAASVLPDGRLKAADWGAELTCSAPLPDKTACVAIRAHRLRPADRPGPNRIPCRIERVTQEVFSVSLVLSTPGGNQGRSLLHMALPAAEHAALEPSAPLWLELPPEALLPLTRA